MVHQPHTQQKMNALKGLYKIAQGQRQRHPGMESAIPFSFTLKGLDKWLRRSALYNPFRVNGFGLHPAPQGGAIADLGLIYGAPSGQKAQMESAIRFSFTLKGSINRCDGLRYATPSG